MIRRFRTSRNAIIIQLCTETMGAILYLLQFQQLCTSSEVETFQALPQINRAFTPIEPKCKTDSVKDGEELMDYLQHLGKYGELAPQRPALILLDLHHAGDQGCFIDTSKILTGLPKVFHPWRSPEGMK